MDRPTMCIVGFCLVGLLASTLPAAALDHQAQEFMDFLASSPGKSAGTASHHDESVKKVSWVDAKWMQCRGDRTELQIKSDIACIPDPHAARDGLNLVVGPLGSCEYSFTYYYFNNAAAPRNLGNGVMEYADVVATCRLNDAADGCVGPLCGRTTLTIVGHAYAVPAWGLTPKRDIPIDTTETNVNSVPDPPCCYAAGYFGPPPTGQPGLSAADLFGRTQCPVAPRQAPGTPASTASATPQYHHEDDEGLVINVAPTSYYTGNAFVVHGNVVINSPRGDVEEVGTLTYAMAVSPWAQQTGAPPTDMFHVEPYTTTLTLREKKEGY